MQLVGPYLKENLMLKAFGIAKIPMIAFLNPSIVELTENKTEIKIPLNWRSKNHLGSMYFGALAVGADLVVGFPVIREVNAKKLKVHFLFKDFKADFLKRAEGGDVHFVCAEGAAVRDLMARAATSRERENQPIKAYAYVPAVGPEPVAEFVLTLSVKFK